MRYFSEMGHLYAPAAKQHSAFKPLERRRTTDSEVGRLTYSSAALYASFDDELAVSRSR